MNRFLFILPLLVLLTAPVSRAATPDSFLLIVSGLGGEDYYSELFQRRAATLLDVAQSRLQLAPDHVVHLPSARREQVLAALTDLANRSQPGDQVLLLLLGHGTFDGQQALFNLPGPDLSAADLGGALEILSGRSVAIVNTAPSSAAFVNALSGPARIIITATSSGAENQHTLFADPFVAAFAEDAADADKDGQVSLLEAFNYANREVEKLYKQDGRIQTEHAQLDDNGDSSGSRAPDPFSGDGALAKGFYLARTEATDAASTERLRLQIEARRLVDDIERLKRLKPALDSDDYATRLESLLIELALNRRAWRAEGT